MITANEARRFVQAKNPDWKKSMIENIIDREIDRIPPIIELSAKKVTKGMLSIIFKITG